MANNFSWGIQFDDKGFKEQLKQDTEALKGLDNAANKVGEGIDKSQNKFINAKKQFNSLKKEILSLTIQYQNLSKEDQKSDFGRNLKTKIDELTTKAGGLKDAMGDLDEKLKNVASDTQFADSMNLMTGTIGNVSSAIVTLTGDSENMKKVLMDVAKIQTVVQAVKSLTEAFQAQNRVLLKNPYMLVAAGIAALAVAIGNYKSKTDDATSSTKELNKSFKDLVETLNTDLGLDFGEGLDGETLDKYVIAQNNAKVAKDKLTDSLQKEYFIQQRIKDGYTNAGTELEKQKEKTAEYRKELKEAAKELGQFKKTEEKKSTPTNTGNEPNVVEYESKLTEPKYFRVPEIKMTLPKASIKGVEVDATGLEVVTPEIKDKYLSAMTLLGEEGQQAFWEAVENGDSWETAFRRATGELDEQVKQLNNVAQAANYAATAFNSLGSSFEQPVLNILGTVAQAIATISLSFAQSLSKSGKLGIWEWVAAAVTGVSTLGAIVAQVKNLNQFADGGIFKGKTTIGDFNLARVNDGEMILNSRQQGNLFRLLDNGTGKTSTSGLNGTVEFKIKGQELVGVISNYNKKMGKLL